MSTKLKELNEKRRKLIADARELNDKVEAEKRDFTDEEKAKFDKLMDEADGYRVKIEREERLAEEERKAAEIAAQNLPENGGGDGGEGRDLTPEQRMDQTVDRFLRGAPIDGSPAAKEFRDLQAEVDTEGGFTVMPEQFINRLIKFIDDETFIRRYATVLPVGMSESLGIPTLDTDPDDADWTSELATGNEDSNMAFGKRSLTPHPLAKRIKVSRKLLRISSLNIEQFVRERLGYKFGISMEKAYLTGDGQGQPLGLFTASNDGISTSRDVSTGNTSTSIQTDGLIEAKYTLKAGYWQRARWTFHRDGVKQIAKLKDGEGQYMWRESVRQGEPDRLLGRPVDMSEHVPNTFTSGSYVGMLGDFSHYWIADSLNFQIQRLIELYAETNQIGMIGRYEGDGMPVLEEAFVRVKLA